MLSLVPSQIRKSKRALKKIDETLNKEVAKFEICADPSRYKLLYLFTINEELCPSYISDILDLSMSAVSHQLRVLEDFGLLDKIKIGKTICYMLSEYGKKFAKDCINF